MVFPLAGISVASLVIPLYMFVSCTPADVGFELEAQKERDSANRKAAPSATASLPVLCSPLKTPVPALAPPPPLERLGSVMVPEAKGKQLLSRSPSGSTGFGQVMGLWQVGLAVPACPCLSWPSSRLTPVLHCCRFGSVG